MIKNYAFKSFDLTFSKYETVLLLFHLNFYILFHL